MLTLRQLDDAGSAAVRMFTEAEQAIISDMARRIAEAGRVTEAANHQALVLKYLGAEREMIVRELSRALKKSEAELEAIFDEAATRALDSDYEIFRLAGYEPIALAANEPLQRIIRAGLKKTFDTYLNLTRTTANTATQQFERALDLSYHLMISGGMSYQQAIAAGIRTMTENGLAAGVSYRNIGIRYPTEWFDYIEVAYRRAALTGVNQTVAEVQLEASGQLGADLVETTAHGSARPEHAVWQGKVFAIKGAHPKYPNLAKETGYGTGPGLCGWNCRHSFFPFIEGVSEPSQSAAEIRRMMDRRVTYNGKKMDMYTATQQQRYIERGIRKWKREESAFEAAGLKDEAAKARKKISEWQNRQRDFIGQTGLRRDYFRERAGKQFVAPRRGGGGIMGSGTTPKQRYSPPAYNPLTDEQILSLQKQSDDLYRNRLTKGGRNTEKTVLDSYTEGTHEPINQLLYGKHTDPPQIQEKYWEDIRLIDSAMDKFDLQEDIVVYSGTNAKHYADWNAGDIKSVSAYLSTSAKESVAGRFYKEAIDDHKTPMILEIYAPKGTKGIYVGNNTGFPRPEWEYLVKRDTNYRVVERSGDRLKLEVVDE